MQRILSSQNSLGRNIVRDFPLSDFKVCFKAVEIKTVWYGHKDIQCLYPWNRREVHMCVVNRFSS